MSASPEWYWGNLSPRPSNYPRPPKRLMTISEIAAAYPSPAFDLILSVAPEAVFDTETECWDMTDEQIAALAKLREKVA
jgi:hypothetical protein